jgi:hypothetical protein
VVEQNAGDGDDEEYYRKENAHPQVRIEREPRQPALAARTHGTTLTSGATFHSGRQFGFGLVHGSRLSMVMNGILLSDYAPRRMIADFACAEKCARAERTSRRCENIVIDHTGAFVIAISDADTTLAALATLAAVPRRDPLVDLRAGAADRPGVFRTGPIAGDIGG